MNLYEWIKSKIFSFKKLDRVNTPNQDNLNYESDEESLRRSEIIANKVWYLGNGDKLLEYYTGQMMGGFAKQPIYNRNKRNYFWSRSVDEVMYKRVHTGIPNAIISTLTNVIGQPTIKLPNPQQQSIWDKIADKNDFMSKLTQQARPLTLAEGFGAWKIDFDKKLYDYPTWEFFNAEDVDFVYTKGILTGIIFRSYYKDAHNKDYLLTETRFVKNGNSYIEYQLFRAINNGKDIEECSFNCIPELAYLEESPIYEIPNFNKVLAVPSKYFYDPTNQKYGKSIYAGKLDLFDMLDEIWSQASQTNRVSTPITWYSKDVLPRGANGEIGTPSPYNRQLMAKEGIPDGEGAVNQDIVVDQPQLSFDKYGLLANDILSNILVGVLSPATMGIDVAKKDNADAQREKEKITIMTRINIIDRETKEDREIVEMSLAVYEYMTTGQITLMDYEVNVKYDEIATPTFDTELQVLGSAWNNNQISTEQYVNMLWKDKLSDEDKQKEIQWLEEKKQNENFDMSQMGDDLKDENYENTARPSVEEPEENETEDAGFTE